jgi:putative aldouronate transport system substrate-binding protein
LKYLQRLYQEKLLDNEAYSQSYQQMVAKGKENKVGMAVAAVPSICFMSDSVIHKILPVLTSPVNTEKMFPITQGINRGSFAITKNNKYPEVTMRWVDYLYSLEGSILMHYSVAGTYWNWADDTKTTRKVNTPPPGLALGQVRGQLTPAPGNVVPKWTPVEIQKSFVDPFSIYRYAEVDSKLMPYGRFAFPLVYNTVDEQKRIDVINRDLTTYVTTMEAKFITGQESLDKWDDYVNTIKKMGVDDLVKINQSVYGRWEIAN